MVSHIQKKNQFATQKRLITKKGKKINIDFCNKKNQIFLLILNRINVHRYLDRVPSYLRLDRVPTDTVRDRTDRREDI